jgi:hypothetical protein
VVCWGRLLRGFADHSASPTTHNSAADDAGVSAGRSSPRFYRRPPSIRALIAAGCFIISLVTPAITVTSILPPYDCDYTFGWEVAFSTVSMLKSAIGQHDLPTMILSLVPFCAQGLLLVVVILEIIPSLFAIEGPNNPRSALPARLSLAAVLPAILSLWMFRFDPRLNTIPKNTEVSASFAVLLWGAAFVTLLIRNWRSIKR